ncbi:hypothetical protein ACIF9R_14910 [Streptomyces sp. NPDC086080]|uniref:hypothetical protein n=1 Tax=Streptomyces sp. NPDC086080 TaxID=3365748 RepID=UPI0037D05475
MRRTARALSLAAVAGTVLGVLAPAASAGTVPGSGPSWGTASPSPCPEPGGHGRDGYASHSAQPEAWEQDLAEPETLREEAFEGAVEDEALTEPEGGVPDTVPEGAEIPPPDGTDAAGSQAMESRAKDQKPPGPETVEPKPGEPKPGEPKPGEPKPGEPKPGEPKPTASKPLEPKPTASRSNPCPSAPAHQGVHAGGGGAFTDSVPALAAGGLLIAGAVGAAAHRLYRDRSVRTEG